MAERIKITVRPSGAHPDVLTVQDAMRQVLDLFDMIEPTPGVEWRLARATTNSPFIVEGEAISLEASVDVSVVARAQKVSLARSLRDIQGGRYPSSPDFRVRPAKKLFERNLNGVGATEVDLDLGEPPILVTPQIAKEAINVLEGKTTTLINSRRAREEVGSVEGTLQEVGTYYNYPAVRILESRTKSTVWCRLSPELQPEFHNYATYADVWQHRRVIVRGRLRYADDGDLALVLATDIRRIEPPTVSLDTLRDPDFTGGLSISEYLDRFRDGTLG